MNERDGAVVDDNITDPGSPPPTPAKTITTSGSAR